MMAKLVVINRFFLSSILVITLCKENTVAICPEDCFCPPMTKNVYCSRSNLESIPDGVPFDTRELTLSDNKFKNPMLTKSNFTNLSSLTNLYLSSCGIKSIAIDTFSGLKKLKWLDISKNELKYVADYTFRGLNLENFFINENKEVQFSENAFNGLKTRGLYMHSCGLHNISLNIFRPLNGSLQALWLFDNNFQRLDKDWLYFLQTLSHVRLGKNKFHCNCELSWLYNFYMEEPSIFSGGDAPSCATPVSHRQKTYNMMKMEDFSCELPIFKNVDIIFERNVGKLTCAASGDPSPVLYWIRPDGTTEKYYPSKNKNEDSEGIMYVTNLKNTEKNRYKCIASNPAGNVTFSIRMLLPELKIPDLGTKISTTTTSTKTNTVDNLSDTYEWTMGKAGKNLGVVSTPKKENKFTVLDIVGAVIGTFLLTLVCCAIAFHFYYRHNTRFQCNERNSLESVNDRLKNVYTMSDHDDRCIKKMIRRNSGNIQS